MNEETNHMKAIIFDVGGVLIRTEDHSYRRHWEEQLGLAERESEEIVFNSEMGQKAQCGLISDEDLWAWVGRTLELGDDLPSFRDNFWRGDRLDDDLVGFIRLLRPTYQTAVISNATDALRHTLNHKHGIADAFDLIVCSAEEKVMKPDPTIYKRTLERLGCRPEESVFIDDFKHNLVPAEELGMATIHFQPGVDMRAELASLKVQFSRS